MNKTKRMAFGIGIVLVALTLAAMTAPVMARDDDVVFHLNTSDGNHGISVAPGEEVTIYLNSYAPVNKTGGFAAAVLYNRDVVEVVEITENESETNWMMWEHKGHNLATNYPDKRYDWFTAVDFVGQGPGHLRHGDIKFRGVSPGVTTMFLGTWPDDIPYGGNQTSITDTLGDYKDWTLAEPFTFTCAAASCPAPGNTVLTSSCELDQSYTVSAGEAGYIIGADGVTIDGKGYKITGSTTNANCEWAGESAPCTVSGIYNAGYDNVEIKNLEIECFCTGVALKGAGADKIMGNTIDNCNIHNNGFNTMSGGSEMGTHGIHACWLDGTVDEPALTITNNEINNNEGTGSACGDGGNGIFIYAGSPSGKHEYCNISYNNLNGNAKAGFWTKMMLSKSEITHNNATGNGHGTGITDDVRGGIIFRCKMTNDNLVAYNNVSNNVGNGVGYGIYVGGDGNTIINNTANESTAKGICMCRSDGSSNNELRNNTVCWNDLDGIYVTGGVTGNTLFDNHVCDNGQVSGVDIYDGDATTGDDNTCDTTHNYDDEGTTGCTFDCPGQTYTISGYTDPAADKVNITNLNKPDAVDDRPADYIGPDGFYNLTLDVPGEVDMNDVLRIIACDVPDNYTSNCNVTDHTVEDIGGEENVNLTLNHYCQNYYPTFPFHTWNDTNWSGPAVMEMLIDNYRDSSDVPNQTELNETGIGYNQGCNADIQYVDPRGMMYTLNKYLHAYNGLPYVANYGVGSSSTTIENVLHYICKWHYKGPGAAPAYGNYSNWMVIRGIHTNKTPSFTQGSYEIYGFWMNDPKDPGGIGENTYKSVEQWKSTYHLKLNKSDVNTSDYYYDRYVAVCEPPEDDDVEVTLAKPKPRLTDAITPELMAKPMMLYGARQLALENVVRDDESRKIVKAATDGVTEELVPYDSEFAAVFAKTVPGKPMLVSSENGNYYIVPFNVPMKVRPPVKIMPIGIEKPNGFKKLGRGGRRAGKIDFKPIPIEPIRVEKTLVVVIVDAADGSFKEASWVADPVTYLPVSKIEAMKLALGEVLDELHVVAREDARDLEVVKQRPTIELVYMDASPYYPVWKITVNGKVFYVSQDGTVSCDAPEEPPVYSSYLAFEADEYNGWGVETLDPTGMVAQMLEYEEACAPIGPVCLPVEIAEEIVDTDPCEAFYITDEPEGVIVPCPS